MLARRHIRSLAAIPTALALGLCLGACGGGGHARPAAATSRPPLQTMMEAQGQLLADPAGTLDRLRRLGVDSVRVFVPWGALAPAATSHAAPAGFDAGDPAAYPAAAWAPYDAIVRAAAARGIGVDLTLEGPAPLWATAPGHPAGQAYAGSWRPRAPDYGRFVHAAARRYSGAYTPPGENRPLPRVSMWSIWNEPNYGPQLAPQAVGQPKVEVAPTLYRNMVDAAWSALQATGHGADTILLGELAPRGQSTGGGPGLFNGMVPLRFLRALYCLDASMSELQGAAARARGCPTGAGARARFTRAHPALFQAAGYALHLYPFGAEAPNMPTPDAPDSADLAAVGHVEHVLDTIMARYGSHRRFPIYDTEFGYKTDPPYQFGVPLATASAYLNWSEYLHWRDPRIRAYDQYLLTDPGSGSSFDTGLEFTDGRPKPLLAAFRLPIYLPAPTAKPGHALEVWGCIRPAGYARARSGRAEAAVLQFQSGGRGAFRDLRRIEVTDADGYVDFDATFPASGAVRLAWRYPHGPTVFSRTVAVTVR